MAAVSLRPDPWEQVERRGSRKEDWAPCQRWRCRQSAGEPCPPARSGVSRRQRTGTRARRVLAK
ncbi:Hypothetical protein ADP8_04207a [Roseomonas mucosa]|nr:Hypothetical protein ADP8_04207a [Roseomonas mucosa]